MLSAIESRHPFTEKEAEIKHVNVKTLFCDYTVTPIMGMINDTDSLLIELYPRHLMKCIFLKDELIANHQTSKELVRGLTHEIKHALGGVRGAAK